MPLRLAPNELAIRTFRGPRRDDDAGGEIVPLHARSRKRQGTSLLWNRWGSTSGTFDSDPDRILTADQLRRIYQATPDIRAPIDSIVRRIATWNWSVDVEADAKDPIIPLAKEVAAHCTRFLSAPTQDGGLTSTWQEFTTALVLDLLINDEGAFERVADDAVGMMELALIHAPSLNPIVDLRGVLLKYEQVNHEGSGVIVHTFKPQEVVYIRMSPSTWTVRGIPIIETLVNEAATMLVASEHAMLALDSDELPPGFLVLGGLGLEAARRAKAELRSQRGADHKARVIAGAGNVKVDWVEVTRSMKDIELINVIDQIQRRIWRAFGVQPVEMGSEDSNRAHAEMQVDVSQSHLVTPILEILQAKIQALVLPGVVRRFFPPNSDASVAQAEAVLPHLTFEFDRRNQLDPQGEKDQATALKMLVEGGMLTRNAARIRLGEELDPAPGADVLTITVGNSLVAVATLTDLTAPAPAVDPNAAPPPAADPAAAPKANQGDGNAGPGEADPNGTAAVAAKARHAHAHAHRELPSSWPNASQFKGLRTIDLGKLGDCVARYQADVDQVWSATEVACGGIVSTMWRDGLDAEDARTLRERLGRRLDQLTLDWETVAHPRYREAARLGQQAADRFVGVPIADRWGEQADNYRQAAFGYLEQDDSPVANVRSKLDVVVASLVTRALPAVGRALDGGDSLGAALLAVLGAFRSERARIANWAGRLVELANEIVGDALSRANVELGSDSPDLWMNEWWDVGDDAECATCIAEATRGMVLASERGRRPGGATECRARCRCVLVFWKKSEVESGLAVLQGPRHA